MRLPSALTLLLLAGTAPFAAEAQTLAETPLSTERCTEIETTKTDPAGEPLPKEQWYASGWRCPGYRGRIPYIAYDDQREGLAFGTETAAAGEYFWPEGFGAWGPSMEWRGKEAGQGTLVAAIARYSWDIQGEGGDTHGKGSDLAVLKVGEGEKDGCILAWVSVEANPNALEIARRYADEQAGDQPCGRAAGTVRLGRERH